MDISNSLRERIREEGYETRSGKIRFRKKLRDEVRKEIGDYHTSEEIVIAWMIVIYDN